MEGLIVVLVVIGVIMYFIPMDANIRNLVYALVVILVALVLLRLLFGWGPLPDWRMR